MECAGRMIDLYTAATANGLRARMALEECGLPYELHLIAREKGEHQAAQFLALNPDAQIPVIVDHDGPGGKPITLSQSSAILVYCAEKSGRLMPNDAAARAAMWQALMSASTDITPAIGALSAVVRSEGALAPAAVLFRDRLRQYLGVWDARFCRQRYAAGACMSLADISLYAPWIRLKSLSPQLCEGLPNIERWAAEMASRSAMKRAAKF